jgi:hypothetical protein
MHDVEILRLTLAKGNPLELVDGVELDPRGAIAHALGGELDLPDDALGQGKQGSKLLTALDCPEQQRIGGPHDIKS